MKKIIMIIFILVVMFGCSSNIQTEKIASEIEAMKLQIGSLEKELSYNKACYDLLKTELISLRQEKVLYATQLSEKEQLIQPTEIQKTTTLNDANKSSVIQKKPETQSSSKTIYTGSRGGQYYINKNGNKTYIKKK